MKMKLKYYLRGLGIGIIVTAVIMGIALGSRQELTDAEIKERAAKLGMIEESGVLLPGTTKEPTSDAADAEPIAETDTDAAASDAKPDTDAAASDVEPNKATSTPKPTADPVARNQAAIKVAEQIAEQAKAAAMIRESEDAVGVAGGSEQKSTEAVVNTSKEPAVITVESGNGSDVVSRKLVEAGLVENAETFDKYLCNHDYDYKITIGKHTIPAGATYDEIARILISAAE